MIALNVERSLISRIGKEGWDAVPNEEREGLSDPAPAQEDYRQSLAEVFRVKLQRGHGLSSVHGGGGEQEDPDEALPGIAEILERDDFQRFVEAQITWDRAMAEALVEAGRASADATIVGVMGRGHMERRHGVPHQLAELGEQKVAVLLPVEIGEACEAVTPGLADAIFLVKPSEELYDSSPKPRLGVMIETVKAGVKIVEVVPGSVAEASGLVAGDVITHAAGLPVSTSSQLVEIILRQAPGTWLPLDIRRDGEERPIVAKFPSWAE